MNESMSEKHKNIVFFSKCLLRHDVVRVLCRSVRFCTGHVVMVSLNLTYLHCLQHSLFEHIFNLYYLHSICVNDTCFNITNILL